MHNSYWLHERLGILWVLHCFFITQNVRTHTCIDILLVYCWVFIVFILFRSKFEYALPAWNVTASNANKLECGSLQLYLWVIFLSYSLQLCCCTELLQSHTVQVTRHQFDALFFIFIFFQDLNFVLPWLTIPVCKFLLVILQISTRFLQDIKISLALDAVNLECSDIDILSNQIR